MGGGESKPERVPERFNIYVFNKIEDAKEIYVRLRGDKLQESESYQRILNETSVGISGGDAGQGGEEGAKSGGKGGINVALKHDEKRRTRQVFSCLTQGGFTFLPSEDVMPFAVENSDRLMYISVHDGRMSWCWDMQVNPQQHGCVTIKEDEKGHISIFLHNPEPRWIKINKEDRTFPKDAVETYQRPDEVVVYLAKLYFNPYGMARFARYLTGVWSENGKFCLDPDLLFRFDPLNGLALHLRNGKFEIDKHKLFTVDVLVARKYAWVKAQRGNLIPPNSVKTTLLVSGSSVERYVGRVGGEKVCAVSITDGMIEVFMDINSSKTTSGEILLLTC